MFKLVVILSILISLSSLADHIREYQEVRLSKAKLAYSRNKVSEAMLILSKNIISRHVHVNSYHFLAKIYLEQSEIIKAMRVYYLLIKRLHTDKLLKANINSIEEIIKNNQVIKVGTVALNQYFLVAKHFFDFALANRTDDKFKDRLFRLSYKYFTICDLYDFKPESVDYYLGVLHNKFYNYKKSLYRLTKVQERFEKKGYAEDKNLKYQIADSLVKSGQRDVGSLYLQSLYQSPATNELLRDYSANYLRNLDSNYLFMKFYLGVDHQTNVHEIDDDRLDNFEQFKFFYKKKSGQAYRKGFNIFGNVQMTNTTSILLSGSYSDNLKTNKDISFQDENYVYLNAKIKYNNLERKIFTFNYSFLNTQFRPNVDSDMKTYSNIHSFVPSFIYEFQKGSLNISLPYDRYKYLSFNTYTSDLGISFTYTPVWVDEYFSPSYTLQYTSVEEITANSDDSAEIELKFTNFMGLTKNISYFFSLTFLNHSNTLDSLSYSQWRFFNNFSFSPPINRNFNLNLSVDYYIRNQTVGSPIKNLTLASEIAYIF